MLTRRDWTLMVISLAECQGLSPVQLQKILFLLGKKLGDKLGNDYYQFIPYHYGPFCADIYNDIADLSNEGYVAVTRTPPFERATYFITPKGVKRAQQLLGECDEEIATTIKRLVNEILPLSFWQLINKIYQEYPDYKRNSVFQEQP
ncbi:MAG: hypothetical protein ABIK42_00515 [candidate division WOR-3 bacterium]